MPRKFRKIAQLGRMKGKHEEPQPLTWVLGIYFDFEQEFPNTTSLVHRCYLRLRSDGKMFWVTRDYGLFEGKDEMFAFFLTDNPMSMTFAVDQYWLECARIYEVKRGRGWVVEIGERQ